MYYNITVIFHQGVHGVTRIIHGVLKSINTISTLDTLGTLVHFFSYL